MVKFQLYLWKLIIQAFKISVQVKQITIQLVVACSFLKNKLFKMLIGWTSALEIT